MVCCMKCPCKIHIKPYSCKAPALITTERTADPRFSGIIHQRSPTDIGWLILFVMCSLLQIAQLTIVMMYGRSPFQSQMVNDSWGHTCGQSPGYEMKLYQFEYSDVAEKKWKVCVESCPSWDWSWVQLEAMELLDNRRSPEQRSEQLFCSPEFSVNKTLGLSLQEILSNEVYTCAVYYFASRALDNKCFELYSPSLGSSHDENPSVNHHRFELYNSLCESLDPGMGNKNSSQAVILLDQFDNFYQGIAQDITRTYVYILSFGLVLGGAITVVWILLMRTFSVALMYFIQIMCNLLIGSVAIFAFHKAYNAAKAYEADMSGDISQDWKYQRSFWTALALIATFSLLVVFFSVFFLKAKIQIASTVIEHSSKSLSYTKECLVMPLFTYFLKISLLVAMVVLMTGLISWMFEEESNIPWYFYLMHVYNFFYTWWAIGSICAFNQVIVTGCTFNWYFSTGEIVNAFIFINSIKRTLAYNLGSVVGGALMKDATFILRVIFAQIDHQVYSNNYNNKRKFCSVFFFVCIKINDCFLKYLDSSAFISVAVYGLNFFRAGLDIFSLEQRSKSKVIMISHITEFVLRLGQFGLAIFTGVIGYCIFSNKEMLIKLDGEMVELNYLWLPILITSLLTYLICKEFFDIFNYAVKATHYCLMEGIERNFKDEKTGLVAISLKNALMKKKIPKTKRLKSFISQNGL